jgi:hypothetical protein
VLPPKTEGRISPSHPHGTGISAAVVTTREEKSNDNQQYAGISAAARPTPTTPTNFNRRTLELQDVKHTRYNSLPCQAKLSRQSRNPHLEIMESSSPMVEIKIAADEA